MSTHHCAADGVLGSVPAVEARQQRSSLHRSATSPKRDGAMKTPRDRAEDKRRVKLDLIPDQVQNGRPVIGQMAEEERRSYRRRPRRASGPGGDTDG